ncbi:hypothetical protein BKA56DRAFT_174357 [Ilyonectria sp. MPI-CAGE-AT-0026]|nr:hypothetical protein BKA56DRAFT_174357 [Ilyonectria sp. MPI-CAGE-AT-0026]
MASTIIPSPERRVGVALRPARVLSNIAAEFVEVKAGREICRRATGTLVEAVDGQPSSNRITDIGDGDDDEEEETGATIPSPKFVSPLDRFRPEDEAQSEAQYYEKSAKMMEKFQETLKRFTKTLQQRKVFNDLKIEYRDPADYDLAYVLSIAELIQEHNEGSENTRTVKKFIRKCFRGATKHKSTITALLSMVPSDAYGSVISGGFSLILVAVESHQAQRLEMQAALADIPGKLYEVQRLSKVHRKSPELHQRADELFLSFFVVLERIIEKVSCSWREKIKRNKDKGGDIQEAVDAMRETAKQFQVEVDICTQYRLGRMEESNYRIEAGNSRIEKCLAELMAGDNMKDPQLAEKIIKEMTCRVMDAAYSFFTSNPNFDPKTGTMTRRSSMAIAAPKRTGSIISIELMEQLIDSWLSGLDDFDPMPENQISECMSGISNLTLEERDRVQWIMASDVLNDWLKLTESQVLNVRAETAPLELVNALSFTAATLAFTIEKTTNYAVLSFFCGLRRNDSRANVDSGPKAILKSLNGQLLKFMMKKRPTSDLSFLKNERLMKKSRGRSKYAKELFRKLLEALPENDVVFVILDSFSRLGGPDKDAAKGDELVEELSALVIEMPLVIKVLVTDALPSCPIKDSAHLTLDVPDDVDGWHNDIDLTALEQKKIAVIDEFRLRQEKGYFSSQEEESSDSSSDSDSD